MANDLPPPPYAVDPEAWETVLDSVEQGFTLVMPRGWQNRAWLRRNGPVPHELATSASPDGTTLLFSGDASLPMFCDPSAFPGPGMVVRPYTSVEHFLPRYTQDRFGRLPGYTPVGMAPCPSLFQMIGEKYTRAGAPNLWVTAAELFFDHQDGPRTLHSVLLAACIAMGPIWRVEVCGASTLDDPRAYVPVLIDMVASRAATPAMHQQQMAERARNAANHQMVMQQLDTNAAILRANHQQNMATLQGMAQAHQGRMDTIYATNDAQFAGWQAAQHAQDTAHAASMRSDDTSHRRFLNMIAEERTVLDSEGNTHQLADGYDRYFQRKVDGTWIGTKGQRDLSDLPGVNPDDYVEGRIKV